MEARISKLFSPIKLRGIEIRNRVFVSPMCQYSGNDGMPTDWHMVHIGTRASGGAGMVIMEATAVAPEGRISPWDLGIWSDSHVEGYAPITRFVRSQGAVPAIQLAHAGRKASAGRPWEGGGFLTPERGGWRPVGPSDLRYDENLGVPARLSEAEIDGLVAAWRDAARRSLDAGFQAVELHFAHGYLAHEFLSPLSNDRSDRYGGSPENRARFPMEIVRAVREVWPGELPLLVRISATEYVDGGWDIDDSVRLCEWMRDAGVDMIDVSSGGNSPRQNMAPAPGYQVPFASEIKRRTGMPTGAVGLITEPWQAERILENGEADVVLLGRELLRNPYWPLHAAAELGDDVDYWPPQYRRAAVKP